RHAGVGGGGGGDELGTEPEGHDHQPGQDVGEVRAVDRDLGEPVDPAPGHQRAGDEDRPDADAAEQPRGEGGGQAHARGDRQVGQAGADRGVPEDVLHVQGEEEEHCEHAGNADELRDVGGGQPFDAEYRQRQQRVLAALLVDHERGQQGSGPGERSDRAGRAPAHGGGAGQRGDQQQGTGGGEQGAEDVEVGQPPAPPVVLEQDEGAGQHDRDQRGLDQEHPSPAGALGQQAAQQNPGRGPEARHAAPGTQGLVALGAVPERGGQDGQGGRY